MVSYTPTPDTSFTPSYDHDSVTFDIFERKPSGVLDVYRKEKHHYKDLKKLKALSYSDIIDGKIYGQYPVPSFLILPSHNVVLAFIETHYLESGGWQANEYDLHGPFLVRKHPFSNLLDKIHAALRELYAEAERLHQHEIEVAPLVGAPAGIGHNRPPSIAGELETDVQQTVKAIEREVKRDTIVESREKFRKYIQLFNEKFIGATADTLAKALVATILAVLAKLTGLLDALLAAL